MVRDERADVVFIQYCGWDNTSDEWVPTADLLPDLPTHTRKFEAGDVVRAKGSAVCIVNCMPECHFAIVVMTDSDSLMAFFVCPLSIPFISNGCILLQAWYDAEVLQIRLGLAFVRYTNYSDDHNEWIPLTRLRPRPALGELSNADEQSSGAVSTSFSVLFVVVFCEASMLYCLFAGLPPCKSLFLCLSPWLSFFLSFSLSLFLSVLPELLQRMCLR